MRYRFIYIPKPRKYAYSPRFYKPEEDENKSKHTLSPNPHSPIRKGMFTSNFERKHKKNNLNFLWLIIITLLLLYLIFLT
ncbi:MAG: hypothetical protein N2Z72_04800 [Bacteroidales bacterium]|nr:hypothetical protein [Bacteroidales bacterium]